MMNRDDKAVAVSDKVALSASMTDAAFEKGTGMQSSLREFAVKLGIPSASQLRKDQLA
jgi:hypothetical protein